MNSQGQLSLEYLIMLGAFFSILLVMAPFIGKAFDLGRHHFEVAQAKKFLLELEGKAMELQVFGSGSRLALETEARSSWRLWNEGREVFLEIQGEGWIGGTELKKEMPVEVLIDLEDLNGKTLLELKKVDEEIYLETKTSTR